MIEKAMKAMHGTEWRKTLLESSYHIENELINARKGALSPEVLDSLNTMHHAISELTKEATVILIFAFTFSF